MLFKPVCDFPEPAHAVLRLARTGQFMIFPVEQAQAGFHLMVQQGCVHLQPLLKGTAVVFVRVDEEGGGMGIGGISADFCRFCHGSMCRMHKVCFTSELRFTDIFSFMTNSYQI